MTAPHISVQLLVGLQVFNSHCAPEPVANMQPEQLTVSELKGRLKELNLALTGRKVISLMEALQTWQLHSRLLS